MFNREIKFRETFEIASTTKIKFPQNFFPQKFLNEIVMKINYCSTYNNCNIWISQQLNQPWYSICLFSYSVYIFIWLICQIRQCPTSIWNNLAVRITNQKCQNRQNHFNGFNLKKWMSAQFWYRTCYSLEKLVLNFQNSENKNLKPTNLGIKYWNIKHNIECNNLWQT